MIRWAFNRRRHTITKHRSTEELRSKSLSRARGSHEQEATFLSTAALHSIQIGQAREYAASLSRSPGSTLHSSPSPIYNPHSISSNHAEVPHILLTKCTIDRKNEINVVNEKDGVKSPSAAKVLNFSDHEADHGCVSNSSSSASSK